MNNNKATDWGGSVGFSFKRVAGYKRFAIETPQKLILHYYKIIVEFLWKRTRDAPFQTHLLTLKCIVFVFTCCI